MKPMDIEIHPNTVKVSSFEIPFSRRGVFEALALEMCYAA